MYGFDNISANNGWAMAMVGGLIVFSGLVVLSLIISQIHKILKIWEKRHGFLDNRSSFQNNRKNQPDGLSAPETLPADIVEVARYYGPLIEKLEQPFQLLDLYKLSRDNGFPHPHMTLQQFQFSRFLISQGDGFFTWHQPTTSE